MEPLTEPESIDTNTNPTNKNRLQQTCTKCRERKIKCDRNTPCRACVARNCADECEYVRTNEDRRHISKAKEIEGLRRELNQLKRRLGDVEAPDQKQARGRQGSGSGLRTDVFGTEDGGASWRGKKRRNVNGAASGDVHDPSGSVHSSMMPGYNGFDATLDGMTSTATTANMFYNGFQSIPQSELSFTEASSIHHNNINTLHTQLHQHPQPDFWRGKYPVLQTIYNIVCDCDDFWVPSIIEIVRTSLSPEEALLAIQRMLLGDQAAPVNAAMHSPESLSSVPVDMGAAAFLGGGVDIGLTKIASPASQSHSSGEG